jgi:hypothetical protein
MFKVIFQFVSSVLLSLGLIAATNADVRTKIQITGTNILTAVSTALSENTNTIGIVNYSYGASANANTNMAASEGIDTTSSRNTGANPAASTNVNSMTDSSENSAGETACASFVNAELFDDQIHCHTEGSSQ